MRPVVAIYSTFMQRAYDQIVHDICIQNLPVVLCMDRAGIVGADGATHAGSFDIAFLRSLPNLTIMAPKDEAELADMLATAIQLDGPSAIRYPRGNGYGVKMHAPKALPVGKGEALEEGKDGLVIAVGTRTREALQACEVLRKQHGKHFTLINLRFIKPLDTGLIIKHLRKGKPLLIVEEGTAEGGIGEAIAALAVKQGWQGPFAHLGIPDQFPAQGTQAEILRDLGLDAAGIEAALCSLLDL
jgi:1-deoxy-D-xylulose-5-phosphate synthase